MAKGTKKLSTTLELVVASWIEKLSEADGSDPAQWIRQAVLERLRRLGVLEAPDVRPVPRENLGRLLGRPDTRPVEIKQCETSCAIQDSGAGPRCVGSCKRYLAREEALLPPRNTLGADQPDAHPDCQEADCAIMREQGVSPCIGKCKRS